MHKKIKYFVMDVDGTLTNGNIYTGNSGEVMKAFSSRDGYGIHDLLIPGGIIPVIITGRKSKIVENRCMELEIENVYQGIKSKTDKLDEILNKNGFGFENVAYIGDDLNDLECMKAVKAHGGLVGCPADAAKEVAETADFISSRNGGNGAVREFIEWITGDREI